MPYDISHLTLSQMTECGAALRRLGRDADCMEAAAANVVAWLRDSLTGPDGEPACPLVRFYKTHEFGDLPPDLRAFAETTAGGSLNDATRCLTLLATAGSEPAWNDRHSSRGHRAIPLKSVEMVRRLPMIQQLVRQLGFDETLVVEPQARLMIEDRQSDFNVFHVPEAAGSPYIPAQDDFVKPYGIASVLGFGGVLPPNELFSVILFSRQPIPEETAQLFKPLSLSTKMAVLPFAGGRIFA